MRIDSILSGKDKVIDPNFMVKVIVLDPTTQDLVEIVEPEKE